MTAGPLRACRQTTSEYHPARFMRRFPTVLSFLFVFFLAATARAQLSTVETPEVQIAYFEGTESYLVPHVAHAFLNALEFERRLFGYDPTQRVTLLLADFSDSGNAAAGTVPRNLMAIQI